MLTGHAHPHLARKALRQDVNLIPGQSRQNFQARPSQYSPRSLRDCGRAVCLALGSRSLGGVNAAVLEKEAVEDPQARLRPICKAECSSFIAKSCMISILLKLLIRLGPLLDIVSAIHGVPSPHS